MFWLGLVVGAALVSIPWWLKVRGLKGIERDFRDAKATAARLRAELKSKLES